MNLRKFISGVSALAIAASAFAGMAVTASAAEATYTPKYTLDLSGYGASDTKISYSITASDQATANTTTAAEAAVADVADFGTGTTKTTAQPALDGWGYIHSALNGKGSTPINDGRQAKLNASNSGINLAGYGNSPAVGTNNNNAAVTFTPTNVDNYSTYGIADNAIVYYSFAAKVTGADRPIGFNKSAGAALSSAASVTLTKDVDHTVIMTYNKGTGAYDISVDGASQASGTDESKSIQGIYATTSNSGYPNVKISNFVFGVYTPASDCAVTFSGAPEGATITVNDTDATNGISLEAGKTYSYVATKSGYQTVYDSFTIADGETTKTVPVSMSAMPTTTTSTNDTAVKQKSMSLTTDGYKTEEQIVDLAPMGLAAGDQLVIEYDMFVTGGESGSIQMTDNNLANNTYSVVGSNITITATENTTTATYTRTTGSYPTINSYSTGQWAHVKYIMNIVKPGTRLRIDSVSAVITPATSGSANAVTTGDYGTTPATRNLASTIGGSYDFGAVKFYGTYSIANAVAYVLAPTVTKTAATNGSYTLSVGDDEIATGTGVVSGSTVTIAATPADGYEVDEITVTDANDNAVTVTNNQFTMPSSNVTVTVTFKLAPTADLAISTVFNETVYGTDANGNNITSDASKAIIADITNNGTADGFIDKFYVNAGGTYTANITQNGVTIAPDAHIYVGVIVKNYSGEATVSLN